MFTDNRANEPSEAMVEAAAKAIADCYNPGMFERYPENWRVEARAALVAAQDAAPARPVIDREELIDVLVMTDLSDYAGTDMRAISQCADAILAHLAADTGGQRDA